MVGIEVSLIQCKPWKLEKKSWFQLTAYGKEYPKESRTIIVWNWYDMLLADFRVNKGTVLCVLRLTSSNDINWIMTKFNLTYLTSSDSPRSHYINYTLWKAAVS